MLVQVINLDRSPERLFEIGKDLDNVGLDWIRIRAFEPDLNYIASTELYDRVKTKYLFGRDLSRGEIGCFCSHLMALKKLTSYREDLGLILEDDAEIDSTGSKSVAEIASKIEIFDPDWRCINLCYTQKPRRRKAFDISGNIIFRAYQFPLLTAAILWNKTSAKKFIDWCNEVGIYAPFDNQLRDWVTLGNHGYSCASPAIGIRAFPSTIANLEVTSPSDHAPKPKNKFTRYELRQKIPLYWRSCYNYYMGH